MLLKYMILGIDIGLKNFSYCLMEENKQIVEWDVMDLTKAIESKKHYKGKFDMIHVCLNILDLFNTLIDEHGDPCNWIVKIENQMPRGTHGITMKTIQGIVTQQLLSMGVRNIRYVCGSCKLKGFNVPKKTYSERKKSAVSVTYDLLKGNDALNSLKLRNKKDDMCDAYLLCIAGLSR